MYAKVQNVNEYPNGVFLALLRLAHMVTGTKFRKINQYRPNNNLSRPGGGGRRWDELEESAYGAT